MKFTQANVPSIRPPAGKSDHWEADEGLPGFYIRFRNGGEGTYFIRYSLHDRDGKLPLGKVSKVKLIEAQNEARQHFAGIAKKEDPAVERAKITVASGVLMPSMFDGFELHLQNKKRSADYTKRTLDYLKGTDKHAYFRPLHVIPLGQLNRATVARELGNIEKNHGPIAMTRARAALSKFFSYCFEKGHEIANPVKGTTKYESDERDRVLQPEELAVIWRESGNDDYGRIVKLLMLTAARRTQMGGLKKSEQKLAASNVATQDRLIELPGQSRKNSRKGGSKHSDKFLIPLSSQALAILEGKAKSPRDGDFVFGEGEGGFSGWSKCKERLDERIGDKIIEPWGFHDFRRSFETLGQDICKIPDNITDACMNHKPQSKKGVRGRYNYATYIVEKREAMEKWGAFIENLTKPQLKVLEGGQAA